MNLTKDKTKARSICISQIIKPVLFIVLAIILEIISFKTFDLQFLPTYFLFDLGIMLIFAGIIFISSKAWLSDIFFCLFLLIQVVFNIINSTILNASDDVFYWNMMTLASEGMKAFDSSFLNVESIVCNCLVFVFGIIAIVLLDVFLKNKQITFKKATRPLLLLVTAFVSWIIGITFYSSQMLYFTYNTKQDNASVFYKDLYQDLNYKVAGFEAFGTYGFYIKDFYNTFIKKVDYESELPAYLEWLKEGETEVREDAALYGKNLILICMETLDSFGLDPINTPNLWKLCYGDDEKTSAGDALFFDNFYSKNKTNISEDIGILGYAPKAITLDGSADSIAFNYSLPHLFKDLGYQTNYFHTYISSFYNRNVVNKNMGFDNLYFIEDVNVENKSLKLTPTNSEVDYFAAVKDKMIPTNGEPFFSFYMTVSGHGGYDEENERFEKYGYYAAYDEHLEEYKNWLRTNTNFAYPADADLENEFRNFKCAIMDNDAMIGKMIADLESKGLLESTTIMIYADHDCYYGNISGQIKGENYVDKYNLPFIIYDGSGKVIERKINSAFTTTYNIYPTVCDLYGLAYNKNMCMGISVFDEDQSSNIMFSTESLIGYFDNNYHSETMLKSTKLNANATKEDLERFEINRENFNEKLKKITFIYNSKATADKLL